MLRRCCRLCSRQLALERSSSSSSSGIASARKVDIASGPSSLASSSSSSYASTSSASSPAMYSTAVLDKHIHESSTASASSEKDTAPRSFWKGKGRAVETPHTAARYKELQSTESPVPQSSRQSDPSGSVASTAAYDELEELLASGNISKALLRVLEEFVEEVQPTPQRDLSQLARQIRRIEAHYAPGDPIQANVTQLISLLESGDGQSTSAQTLEQVMRAFIRHTLDQDTYRTNRRAFQKLLGKIHTSLHQEGILDWQQLDRTYASVVAEFTKRKRWKTAIDTSMNIYKEMGRWSPLLLQAFLEASLQAEDYSRLPTFAAISEDLGTVSPTIYSLLVTAYLSARQMGSFRDVIQAVQKERQHLDPAVYTAIVRGYRSAGMLVNSKSYVGAIQELVQITDRSPSELLNGLIQAHIRDGDLGDAHTAYELFHVRSRRPRQSLPSLPSPLSFGSQDITQDSASASSSLLNTPLPQVLKGLIPTAETFSSFVTGYTALGNLDQALDYYADMIDQGYTPAPFLSTALQQAFQKHGRPAEELKTIIQQVEEGTASRLEQQEMRSPSVARQAREVLETSGVRGFRIWLEQVASHEKTVETAVISELLHYLRQTQQMSALSLTRLARHLRRSTRSPPTLSDLNILLQALSEREARNSSIRKLRYARDGTQASILPIFQGSRMEMKPYVDTVKQLYAERVEPDARTVTIIMQRFANNNGSPRTLWQYFCWQILDRHLPASPHHISALMTAYIRQGDIYGARRALDRGQALGVEPNLHHYTILVDNLLKRNQSALAEEILLQMQTKGIYPDLHIFGILANWAARRGKLEQVHDLIRRASPRFPDQQKRPNVVLQNAIFIAHNTRREFVLGQHQLKEALSKGMIPDRQFLHMNARLLQDMGRNLRLETGRDLAELRTAIPQAKQNQLRMMKKLRAVGRPYESTASGRLDRRELRRVVAVFGSGRRRSTLSTRRTARSAR